MRLVKLQCRESISFHGVKVCREITSPSLGKPSFQRIAQVDFIENVTALFLYRSIDCSIIIRFFDLGRFHLRCRHSGRQ